MTGKSPAIDRSASAKESGRERRFRTKNVLYIDEDLPDTAREFVPHGPFDLPTVELVAAFRRQARKNPRLRLDVLTHLRLLSDDRVSTLNGAGAIYFGGFVGAFAVVTPILRNWAPAGPVQTGFDVGAVVSALVTVGALAWILNLVTVLHKRRTVCDAWLRAFEDEQAR